MIRSDSAAPERTDRDASLSLERLESRLLLSTVSGAGVDTPQTDTITDANGDELLLTFSGPVGSQVEVLDSTGSGTFSGSAEDDIGYITFTGTDSLSAFGITDVNPGVGGDDIDIVGGAAVTPAISTAGGEDMGTIALGLQPDGTTAGTTEFAGGAGTEIGGRLGAYAVSGPLDFADTFLRAGGDIGLVWAPRLVLNSLGQADITAGSGGNGDLSHLLVGQVDERVDSTVGPQSPMVATPGSPVTINDDADGGGTGRLLFSVSGPAAEARINYAPLPGGGRAVAGVNLLGDDSVLNVRGFGTGGDVSQVDAAGNQARIRLGGARGMDLGKVRSPFSLREVANLSLHGDILGVEADGEIGSIVTQPTGRFGMLFEDDTNSQELFPTFGERVGRLSAGGDVGFTATGTFHGLKATVGGNYGLLNTRGGGIFDTHLMVDGNLDRVRTTYTQESNLWVGGSGRSLTVGGQGSQWTDFTYLGGLDTASFRGGFTGGSLSAVDESGASPIGGRIGRFFADELYDVTLEALEGFGRFSVAGAVAETEVDTGFFDSSLGETVGGGIGALSLGYAADSFFDVFADIDFMRTGTLADGTTIASEGDLGNGTVGGDLLDSDIDIEGNVTGALRVFGDVLDDSGDIEVEGNANVIFVAGSLAVSRGIDVGGNANRIVVGGATEGADIEVDGNARFISVGFLDDFTDIDVEGNADFIRVGKTDEDSDILVGGSARQISVGMVHGDSEIDVSGDLDVLFVGQLSGGGEIFVGGNSQRMVLLRATHIDDIEIGGNAGTIVLSGLGAAIDGDNDDLTVGGTLGLLRITNGLVEYDIEVEGDVQRAIIIGGSITDSDVDVGGRLPVLVVARAIEDTDLSAEGGFGRITAGILADVDIDARDWDDASGDPTGGGIDSLQFRGGYDIDIDAHQDLRRIQVGVAFKDVDIDLSARDNFGSGDLVGGGGIRNAQLPELTYSSITTYGSLGRVFVGAEGVGKHSSIETLSEAEGDVGSFVTSGLFRGDALIRGDVNLWRTAGRAIEPRASFPSPLDSVEVDRVFTESDGAPIDGTLAVLGGINLVF